jgi:hypothetical protein
MFLCKGVLQIIDCVFFHIDVVAYALVLVFIILEFLAEDKVLLLHLTDEGFDLQYLTVYL